MVQEWREKAECKGLDSNIFVPLGRSVKGRRGRGTYTVARNICSCCPVTKECLDFAINEVIEYGMYGGKTPRERRALRWKHDVVQ